jgi:hypothetical protein
MATPGISTKSATPFLAARMPFALHGPCRREYTTFWCGRQGPAFRARFLARYPSSQRLAAKGDALYNGRSLQNAHLGKTEGEERAPRNYMTRHKIIVNSTAGRGAGDRAASQIEALLGRRALDFDLVRTRQRLELELLLAQTTITSTEHGRGPTLVEKEV